MKRFLLMPNEKKDHGLAVTGRVIGTLLSIPASVIYLPAEYEMLTDGERIICCEEGTLPADAEAVITIGGDGTVLEASRPALRLGIPLLGINLGRLGYLSELEADRLEDLVRLADGAYCERTLMTLCVTLRRDGRDWEMPRLAVNDVIFYRSPTGHMIDLTLTDEAGGTLRYRADGLILATPTGSTAYSLSAGGPVLSGSFDCICATPVCPHSFFNRSILFDGDSVLHMRSGEGSEERILVTLDGRENIVLEPDDEIIVRRSSRRLRLLSPEPRDFLGVLRKKMKLTE